MRDWLKGLLLELGIIRFRPLSPLDKILSTTLRNNSARLAHSMLARNALFDRLSR